MLEIIQHAHTRSDRDVDLGDKSTVLTKSINMATGKQQVERINLVEFKQDRSLLSYTKITFQLHQHR